MYIVHVAKVYVPSSSRFQQAARIHFPPATSARTLALRQSVWRPGLPDGIFSKTKIPIWENYGGFCNVGILYIGLLVYFTNGQLVYFVAIRYILWLFGIFWYILYIFGIFCGHFV
jgi:hypothetical protein